jgi:hypothetical protein
MNATATAVADIIPLEAQELYARFTGPGSHIVIGPGAEQYAERLLAKYAALGRCAVVTAPKGRNEIFLERVAKITAGGAIAIIPIHEVQLRGFWMLLQQANLLSYSADGVQAVMIAPAGGWLTDLAESSNG